jgi:general secretion pathway protein K
VGLPKDRTEASRGFALLVVLWFLVLIAAIGMYLMANARSETAIARNTLAAARAEALADAGVAQALFNLTGTLASRWNLDGAPHRLLLPAGEVTIRLHDETEKINPNRASEALMSALFEVAGANRMRARRLGAAVADWVGMGTEMRQFGAKEEQYRDAGKSYAPPNAPIESIDELQLVLGMTPEIFASVRPYLTIHTGNGQPDGKNAPRLIRQALSLAIRESDGIAGPTDNLLRNPDVPEVGATAPANADSAAIMSEPAETVVEIEVRALDADGGIFVRHAVMRIKPENPKGYVVLDWVRGDLVE